MEAENLERRMERLKKRRTVIDKPDSYLELLLEDALDCFLEITHRRKDPGECIDGLLCEMANYASNQEGAEHASSVGEDSFSRSWAVDIPDSFYKRMLQYRLVVGVNAEHDL